MVGNNPHVFTFSKLSLKNITTLPIAPTCIEQHIVIKIVNRRTLKLSFFAGSTRQTIRPSASCFQNINKIKNIKP